MRKIVLAALFSTAFATTAATPALAQDQAPFTGLRAEGIVGYDRISDGESDDEAASSDGVLYGGQIGYDFQAGGIVLGVEGEIIGSTTDTRATNYAVAGDRLSLDAGRDLYAGARVGFLVSPTAMVYAKGGYTNARLDAEYSSGTISFRDSAELDGFRVGAGLEYQMGPRTYLKGEYRFSNYSRISGFDSNIDRHQLLGGLGVRF